MNIPRIELERVILRGREERDEEPLIRFLVDPINTKYLPPVESARWVRPDSRITIRS